MVHSIFILVEMDLSSSWICPVETPRSPAHCVCLLLLQKKKFSLSFCIETVPSAAPPPSHHRVLMPNGEAVALFLFLVAFHDEGVRSLYEAPH